MEKILLLCVSVISLAACSKGGGSSASLTEDATSFLTAGTYSSGCQTLGPTLSFLSESVVDQTDMEFTSMNFEDNACAQPRLKYYTKNSYVDVGASSVVTDARNINVTQNKVYMTPMSAQAVTDLNGWNECGFSDWTINVTKDVSATSCQEPSVGTITYTIARTINDQFEFGFPDSMDPTLGTTSNLRLNVLSAPLTKQ